MLLLYTFYRRVKCISKNADHKKIADFIFFRSKFCLNSWRILCSSAFSDGKFIWWCYFYFCGQNKQMNSEFFKNASRILTRKAALEFFIGYLDPYDYKKSLFNDHNGLMKLLILFSFSNSIGAHEVCTYLTLIVW